MNLSIFLFFFKVKDIYGGDCTSLGLPGDLIASSFGKAAQAAPESIQGVWNSRINFFESRFFFFYFHNFSMTVFGFFLSFLHGAEADIARSLLFAISNDIGQIASLYAMMHGLKKVY